MAQCETVHSLTKTGSLGLSLGQQPLPPTLPWAEGDAVISETLNWTSGVVPLEWTWLNLYSQGTVYSLGQKRKIKLAFLISLFGPPPGSIWACHTFQEGATAQLQLQLPWTSLGGYRLLGWGRTEAVGFSLGPP